MAKEGQNSTRKDNRIWSILYAFTSLKQQPVRNTGIALLLAIGIALPTMVIAWSQTSIYVHLDELYVSDAVLEEIKDQPGIEILDE